MKLHFDPNQDYQLEAIQSVLLIFEGQPLSKSDFELSFQTQDIFTTIQGVANQISLTEEQILKNVQSVQKKNELSISSGVQAECDVNHLVWYDMSRRGSRHCG